MATNPTIPAELLTLISRIYYASLNTSEWPCVVESIAALYESDKALLMTPGQLPQDGGLIFPVGITATALQQWESHYAPHDVWVRVSLERNLFQEGAVVTDEDLFPFDELLLTIWYQEFLSQIGIARLLSGVILGSSPNRGAPCILSVFRGRDDSPFSSAHRGVLELLIPHLSRSLGIMLRLRSAEMQVASSLSALDTIRSGIILIGEQGQVVHANHAAQAIFLKGDGLGCRKRTPPG